MAKARLFDLPETKGEFQLVGIVSGMSKDNAYKELVTKSNRAMRFIKFGLSYGTGKLYMPIYREWNRIMYTSQSIL